MNAGVAAEPGVLVFADQDLVAVLVHLEADFYDFKGQWHLEVGFAPVPEESRCFATLDEAITWIEQFIRSDSVTSARGHGPA